MCQPEISDCQYLVFECHTVQQFFAAFYFVHDMKMYMSQSERACFVCGPLWLFCKMLLVKTIVVLLLCGCLSLNPFIEFRIWNNSSSPDVLNVQPSISVSPKYESKSKTTSHCHLLLHDCTNVAV